MNTDILKGKKILIVDDEPDIIETLEDALEMCQIESARDFGSAINLLKNRNYDATILDIMGVNGYGLLDIAIEKNIPALILTAHALSAENFKRSITAGAHIYLPKDKMIEIDNYLTELIVSSSKKEKKSGLWFIKLAEFFNQTFGPNWQKGDAVFWKDFNNQYVFSREELESVL